MSIASNRTFSISPQKQIPTYFIQSLYSLIESQKYLHLINWTESEKSFVIYKPTIFAEEALHTVCSHSNLSSFIRQLNMYDFKKYKDRSKDGSMTYSHPFFLKGKPDLLIKVLRKNSNKLKEFIKDDKFSEIASTTKETTSEEYIGEDRNERFESKMFVTSRQDTQNKKILIEDMQEHMSDNRNLQIYQQKFEIPEAHKKIKYSSGFANLPAMSQEYVQIDFNTLNYTIFDSHQTKRDLNSQLSAPESRIFNGRDFFKCQNLIANLFASQPKSEPVKFPGVENSFSQPQMLQMSQRLGSNMQTDQRIFGEDWFYNQ